MRASCTAPRAAHRCGWRSAANEAYLRPYTWSCVYGVRMARVNITVPDDLYRRARNAGLNVSQLAQRAVGAELSRLAKIAELDAYLAELEAELGPTPEAERAEAKTWADQLFGPGRSRRSA